MNTENGFSANWSEPKTLAEMAAESAEQSACGIRGIPCPRCGLSAWRVWYTRDGVGFIKRKRRCLNPACGHEIVTRDRQRPSQSAEPA